MSGSPGGRPRPGRGGRTKSGKPRPGTGGHGKRKLEGKGPTPPAHLRPGHPAQRRTAAGGSPPGRPETRAAAGDDSEPGPAGNRAPGNRPEGTRPGGTRAGGTRAESNRAGGNRPGGTRPGDAPAGRARAAGGARGGAHRNAGPGRVESGEDAREASASRFAPQAPRARGAGDAPETVAGRNAVLESLRAGAPATALHVALRLDADDRVGEAVRLAAGAGVPVVESGRAELDRLTGGALHQGVALRLRAYTYAHADDLTGRARAAGEDALIVALDGITDPRNLGAIVRSAAALGGHGVLVPARRSARVTAGAWKSSAGALARLPVARAPNLAQALASYAADGLFIVGLDATGQVGVRRLEVAAGPVVFVVGAEGRGLSRLVAQRCDLLARIPVTAASESLNASVAAAIALHEAASARQAAAG